MRCLEKKSEVDKDFAAAFNRKLEVPQWLSANRRDGLWNDKHRMEAQISVPLADAPWLWRWESKSNARAAFHTEVNFWENYRSLLSDNKWFESALRATGGAFWSLRLSTWERRQRIELSSPYYVAQSRARSQHRVKSPFWSFCLMLRTILACPWCRD